MTPSANAGSGRPRDPTMEQRVRQAACDLYGRVGWAGFSIDAVAREARVGKSSIYLRWPDQTALLLDTLQARIALPLDTDTGSLRSDLIVLSRSIFDLLASDVGDAVVRLSAEARSVPELAPRWADFVGAQAAAMRAITQRGIARGDLPEERAGDGDAGCLVRWPADAFHGDTAVADPATCQGGQRLHRSAGRHAAGGRGECVTPSDRGEVRNEPSPTNFGEAHADA